MSASNEAAQRKRRRILAARGVELLVDSGPAAAHIRALQALGWSLTQIEQTTSVARCSMRNALKGNPLRWETERKILALRLTAPGYQYQAPSLGAVRRLRALYAAGHDLATISSASGLSYTFASGLANGHKATITSETDTAIRRAYDTLSMSLGSSHQALGRARREGWASPLFWDENTIDDPAGFPDWTGHCGSASGWLLHQTAGQEPCGPCTGHAMDLEHRPRVTDLVVILSGALGALRADNWPWPAIADLFHIKPDYLRSEYTNLIAAQMETAA